MTSREFVQELREKVGHFCTTLDERPPAYSYVPLRNDEQRVRVMKSRLFNELRAAELFGGWLKTTSELDVKAVMARSAHEEMVHAALLSARIRELGADPFAYRPLPAQMSMLSRGFRVPVNGWQVFLWPEKGWRITSSKSVWPHLRSLIGSKRPMNKYWLTKRVTAAVPKKFSSSTP